MPRKPVAFRIDEDLLARVDAEAGRLGQTRTVFVERALEKALGELAGPPTPAPPRASQDYDVADSRAYSRAQPKAYTPPRPKGDK